MVALAASPARALHKESPPAYRITSGASHPHPQTRSWGSWFAFPASEDLAHTGNTRQEIFFFNLAFFDCFQGTTFPTTPCENPLVPFLKQITASPGNPDNPSLATPFALDGTLTRIGSGNRNNGYECQPFSPNKPCTVAHWLAFDALGSFSGSTGPDASHRQIFLKNLVTDEIRQVTHGTDGDSVRPNLDSIGGVVVFESNAHLTFAPTPAGITQVYVYETKSRLLHPLTAGYGPSTQPIANQDGGLIAFQSSADLLGSQADTGITQIFWAEYDKTTHTAVLQQLTHGNASSENPYIAEVNSFILFDSAATNLPGTLGDVGSKIFYTTPLKALSPQPPQLAQLTDAAHFADCHSPFVDAGSVADHIGFICTGDPLQNGTVGNRVFIFERSTLTLMQITGRGDVQAPIGGNLGSWFVTMSTTSDLTGQGGCGYQLYVVDYLGTQQSGHTPKWIPATQIGELPPDAQPGAPGTTTNVIGARNFIFLPGDGTNGSDTSITTSDGTTTTPLSASPTDGFHLVIGSPDETTQQASIAVPAARAKFPPIADPTYGKICIAATADGEGVIDCDGTDPGGDLLLRQDHNTDDTDPQCLTGCREDDPCQGPLPGPHLHICPHCVNSVCSDGPNVGLACVGDADCADEICLSGPVGVCNGPLLGENVGAFAAGGMRMAIPVTVSISRAPGLDGRACTADDQYAFQDLPMMLSLTSGQADTIIDDNDNLAGSILSTSDTGAPFNCAALQAGAMPGVALVGTLPILDVPQTPGLRDVIVGFHLVPRPDDQSCQAPCASNLDCDDGNTCNGSEVCVSGACLPGTAMNCDDGDPCTADGCDPTTGTCTHAPCDDGNPCNGTETCDATGCHLGTPIQCSNNNACDGLETCDPATGTCLPGTAPNCDDANPCTDDSCDAVLGCVHTPNSLPCDDGNACTLGDSCQAGTCTGTPISCDDGNVCNGFESCDPATGACLPGTPPTCDDGNPCTDDFCDPTLGCLSSDNTNPCDDGNPCTTGDVCAAGTCSGTPVSCSDGNFCNGQETCSPVDGSCQPGPPPTCDDANPCTVDSCDSVLGCVHTPAPDGGACDDGNACTTGDTCLGGLCGGLSLDCNDNDPCTLDACNPVDGSCIHTPDPSGGVLCALTALQVELGAASPSTVGGSGRKDRLQTRLVQVHSRIVRALGGKRPTRNAQRSYQSLSKFKRIVQRGMSAKGFDPQVSTRLIALDDQVIGQLLPMLAAHKG